jgi:hypothetical protein
MPPELETLSLLKSTSAKPGASISARYRVLTPIIVVNGYLRSSCRNAAELRGSVMRIVCAPSFANSRAELSA